MRLLGRCVLFIALAVAAAGCQTPKSSVTLLRQPVRRFPSNCPVRLFKTQPPPQDAVAIVRLQATCQNDAYDACVRWLAAKTCEAGGNVLYDLRENFVTFGRDNSITQLVVTALGGYSAWAEIPQPALPMVTPAAASGAVPIAPSSPGAAPNAPIGPAACVPECRQGFDCVLGQCVSSCNPPCAAGERCVGHGAGAACDPAAASTAGTP